MWWIPAAGGKVLRVLLGSYEAEQSALFVTHVTPGSRLLDLGASHGYYALLGARLVGPSGAVLAFEPDPHNAAYLRRHCTLNRLGDRVEVRQMALGEHSGFVRFGGGGGTGTGRLCKEGALEVQVVALDEVDLGPVANPTHLKIDVEGGELALLRGAAHLIDRARPMIFLSTHGDDVHRGCLSLLEQWRYSSEPIGDTALETATEIFCRPR